MKEKFYLEEPTMGRKQDALDYINEFYEYNSSINGVGGLDRYLDDYDGWLKFLDDIYNGRTDWVPALTFFFVRSSDKKIVGMINTRFELNDYLRRGPGHIGYSIRPTERGNGYNKINLYLGLKVCRDHGVDNVLMDASLSNPASWKTMEALGGVRVKEWADLEDEELTVNYEIDTNKSIEKYGPIYEPMIDKEHSKVR